MSADRILGTLEFLREAERLKSTLRSGYTSEGRSESVAEHSWRLCLMALVFADEFGNIDLLRLIKLCIVHDLGEALSGDIPAVMQTADTNKSVQERADLEVLTQALAPQKRAEIIALWEEYETAASPEAIIAKGLDKLETILQHNQGKNPESFDYAFNLGYGQKQTSAHPFLAAIRAILDEETHARAKGSNAAP